MKQESLHLWGEILVIISLIIFIPFSIALYRIRQANPVKGRIPTFVLLYNAFVLLFFVHESILVLVEHPCWVDIWLNFLLFCICLGLYVYRGVRLLFLMEIAKNLIESHFSKKSRLGWYVAHRSFMHPAFVRRLFFCLLILYSAFPFAATFFSSPNVAHSVCRGESIGSSDAFRIFAWGAAFWLIIHSLCLGLIARKMSAHKDTIYAATTEVQIMFYIFTITTICYISGISAEMGWLWFWIWTRIPHWCAFVLSTVWPLEIYIRWLREEITEDQPTTWDLTLEALLLHEEGFAAYVAFLRQEFQSELALFWREVYRFKSVNSNALAMIDAGNYDLDGLADNQKKLVKTPSAGGSSGSSFIMDRDRVTPPSSSAARQKEKENAIFRVRFQIFSQALQIWDRFMAHGSPFEVEIPDEEWREMHLIIHQIRTGETLFGGDTHSTKRSSLLTGELSPSSPAMSPPSQVVSIVVTETKSPSSGQKHPDSGPGTGGAEHAQKFFSKESSPSLGTSVLSTPVSRREHVVSEVELTTPPSAKETPKISSPTKKDTPRDREQSHDGKGQEDSKEDSGREDSEEEDTRDFIKIEMKDEMKDEMKEMKDEKKEPSKSKKESLDDEEVSKGLEMKGSETKGVERKSDTDKDLRKHIADVLYETPQQIHKVGRKRSMSLPNLFDCPSTPEPFRTSLTPSKYSHKVQEKTASQSSQTQIQAKGASSPLSIPPPVVESQPNQVAEGKRRRLSNSDDWDLDPDSDEILEQSIQNVPTFGSAKSLRLDVIKDPMPEIREFSETPSTTSKAVPSTTASPRMRMDADNMKLTPHVVLHMFDCTQGLIYNRMKTDSFQRFRRTSAFVQIATRRAASSRSSTPRARTPRGAGPQFMEQDLMSRAIFDASTLIDNHHSYIVDESNAASNKTSKASSAASSATQSMITLSTTKPAKQTAKRHSFSHVSKHESGRHRPLASLFVRPQNPKARLAVAPSTATTASIESTDSTPQISGRNSKQSSMPQSRRNSGQSSAHSTYIGTPGFSKKLVPSRFKFDQPFDIDVDVSPT